MKDFSTILSKFQEKFSKHGIKLSVEDGAAKVELMSEAVLQDGTKIYTNESEWKVGAEAFTMDEQGNTVPLADGEYVVQDGSKLVIVEGKVAEIATAEAEAGEGEMEMSVTREEFESVINGLIDAFEQKLDALNAEKTQLSAQITELSKKPAASSVRKTTQVSEKTITSEPSKSFAQMTLLERISKGLNN